MREQIKDFQTDLIFFPHWNWIVEKKFLVILIA